MRGLGRLAHGVWRGFEDLMTAPASDQAKPKQPTASSSSSPSSSPPSSQPATAASTTSPLSQASPSQTAVETQTLQQRSTNASTAPGSQPASSPGSIPKPKGTGGPRKPGAKKRKGKKGLRKAAPPPPPPPKPKGPHPALLAGAVAAGALVAWQLIRLIRRKLRGGAGEAGGAKAPKAPCANVKPSAKCVALADGSACVVRREIPADNSCLFNAIAYCMHGSKQKAAFLRGVVAREVSSDPETYSAAFLGMPNMAYCNWIVQPQNWGGGIELAILSRHYGREIGAWNIESGKQHVFGEDAAYPKAVMLIYTGTHYDALAIARSPRAPESEDKTEFNPRTKAGKMAVAAAQKLVQLSFKGPKGSKAKQTTKQPSLPAKSLPAKGKAAQANGNKAPAAASGALQCADCGEVFAGQAEAAKHAAATQHTRFAQVKK